MTKPQVKEHNAETGEEVIRDMTDDEFAAYKKLQAESLQAIEDAKAAEKAKEAAQAKLTALGLTIDDLKALGL